MKFLAQNSKKSQTRCEYIKGFFFQFVAHDFFSLELNVSPYNLIFSLKTIKVNNNLYFKLSESKLHDFLNQVLLVGIIFKRIEI